jgi:micrococcal nuclease
MITLAATTTVDALDVDGKVVSVVDGNTIEILSKDNLRYSVVLAGIDSPESEQEFGGEARKFVSEMILNKKVTLRITGKDKSGKYLGIVFLGDEDVRIDLLKAGLAWTQEKHPDEELEAYRQWAEKKKKGLWASPDRTAPWEFRRQRSMLQPKSS